MKRCFSLFMALILMLGIAGCAFKSKAPKTFEIPDAEKLMVMSGSTGESIDITDKDDIKYITDNICALKYSNKGKVDSDGWSYFLQWFDENGEVIEKLTLTGDGYTVIYDGCFYKGMEADYEIDLQFLEDMFQ